MLWYLSWSCRVCHCLLWQIFQIQQLCMYTGSFTRGSRFSCLQWYKHFIDEWRQYISWVFIFAFLIQFAKIKTSRKFLLIQYTVIIAYFLSYLSSGFSLDATNFSKMSSKFLAKRGSIVPGNRSCCTTSFLVSSSVVMAIEVAVWRSSLLSEDFISCLYIDVESEKDLHNREYDTRTSASLKIVYGPEVYWYLNLCRPIKQVE